MNLSQFLKPWLNRNTNDCFITDLKNDSRTVQAGDLFLAYPGAVSDGRLFIDKAVASGAGAIAYDPRDLPSSCSLPQSIPCIAIPELSQYLAEIAKNFYNDPGKDLYITGVTGTNGKTTIAYQLAQAHELLKHASAYIGTIGQGNVYDLKPLDNTTPDALCLQRLFSVYKSQGIKQVCMEVSSHALSQQRVDGIDFKQALFTNLTLDHLDYHHSMQAYGAAKALLFEKESLEWAILNKDDTHHLLMSQALHSQVKQITYGVNDNSDVRALSWHTDIRGTEIKLESPWGKHEMHISAVGLFNIYNSLAIWSSLLAQGYVANKAIEVMSQLKPAPGRMEIVAHSPFVLVDYAHTPDALENVLITLNQLKKGKLWVIFGCGGDRDKSKRPIMGKAASLHADHVVLTSDNPRTEDPELILKDIAKGISYSSEATQLVQREEAIAYVLNKANKDDIILIAGKGHESYQQIGTKKFPFSDQQVVKKLLNI